MTTKLNLAKLDTLLPVIDELAMTRPYSMAEVIRYRDGAKVILPVPGSSFPVEIRGEVKYGDQWTVTVSSGSWSMGGVTNSSQSDRLRIYSQVLQLAAAIATILETAGE